MRTVGTLLLTVLFLIPSVAGAQREPAGEFGGLIEVTEIFLDIVATDKKGNAVRGLGKDDFIVTEEGKRVEITSASFYTTRYDKTPGLERVEPDDMPRVESAGESATEVPSSRYFILFFHDQSRNASGSNRLLQQQLDASRRAHDWVRDSLSGSDWVAVVSYDVKLRIHQDFTQDRGSLLAAIPDAAIAKDSPGPTRSELKRQSAGTVPSLWRGLPDPADLRKETTRMYDAVRLIAEASRPMIGRKNLLLFTIGFGQFDTILGITRPDERYYPAMEQALNDSNVAVYPIHLAQDASFSAQSDFLSQLASDSGGYFYRSFVNFTTPLERVSKENTGYYLLSFRTEHPAGETGYREIKVKSKKGKVRVRARKGYKYGVGG